MKTFSFNPISVESVEEFSKNSRVFNMTKDNIEREKVILSSFYDEKLGSAQEKLDIALFRKGKWDILDIDERISGYNEIPLGYVVSTESYDKVMVILRRMSTMVLDKVKEGISTYIYSVVPERFRDVQDNAAMLGMLAKNQICLDGSEEMYRRIGECNQRDSETMLEWVKMREEV